MISLIDLVFIYTLYVLAIGIVYNFEITIFESLKKSVTLPHTSFKHLISAFKPRTPLQKEIREEERTIKQLEKQKADMQKLEELKRKREALFEEVGDNHAEDAGVRLTSHIVKPDVTTHENTYFCHRCEENKTLNMMSKENSILLICKNCEEEIL